jgi:natural product biosynthesis luciferase-like monooxygenase protein/amino acid adenylation domain-containing protein
LTDDKYRLLFESAAFADQHGFAAIWLPERHFHSFGGLSPNPSVLCAALARETRRLQLRAGSVVLPLHHPIRVAEEWSIVDNLSGGRVGVAFASGWHPNDFVFAPDAYGKHRDLMFQGIEHVQRLWSGQALPVRDGSGETIEVKLFPMPRQSALPIWITVVNNPETFAKAGEIGAGILTNLMGQTVEDLARNLAVYREARARAGHDPDGGQVTVLLHTFVGEHDAPTRQQARQPFSDYLRSSIGLFQNMVKSQGLNVDFDALTDDDRSYIMSIAYDRYVASSALIGSVESCAGIVKRLSEIGVNEIGCFIDFGVDPDSVLASLPQLHALQERVASSPPAAASEPAPAHPAVSPIAVTEPAAPALSAAEKTVPLSLAQQQLWFLAQMGNDSTAAYNESVMLALRGPVRADLLHSAFQQVVDRHEALRVVIGRTGDAQRILPTMPAELPLIDLSGYPAEERAANLQRYLLAESAQPFDLAHGPLVRMRLIKLAEESHLVLLTGHHIVVDGWAIGLIIQELGARYTALCQNQLFQPEPSLQLSDYMAWHAGLSESDEMPAHAAYWLERFAGPLPALELPVDRPHPPIKSYKGARHSIVLDKPFTSALRKVGSQEGKTLFVVLLGAYLAFLHRITGQDDLVVGIPAMLRSLEGGETLVGHCVDLMPIRSSYAGQVTMREFLSSVGHTVAEASEHQSYTFAMLLNQLNPPRDASRTPIIATTFNLDRPIPVPSLHGLEIDLLSPPISYAKFELGVNVTQVRGELRLDIDYNTDLFDATTIQRLQGHFVTFLHGLVADPNQQLAMLPLLTDGERRELLELWNATSREYPKEQTIQALFEAQVERTPDAVALRFEDMTLSYHELNQQANRVAARLHALGVGPETAVPICVERSCEMISGLLGILKAGGVYVPLDPTYPAERLALMLQDTQATVVLTQRRFAAQLQALDPSLRIVCLDDMSEPWTDGLANPPVRSTPDSLAYMMYTSGSTGRSKGIMITQRSVVRLVRENNYAELSADHVFLQLAPFAFDAATFEIWGALLNGAQLVIFSAHRPSLTELGAVIRQRGITTLWLTAGLFHLMVEEQIESLRQVRQILAGGDVVSARHVRMALEAMDGGRVINGYGPTENTTFTCCYPMSSAGDVGRSVPIGYPIAQTQVYVLDRHLQPVPIGVPGELFTGGDGLARGYVGRPDLTAETFIPDPFSATPGARLYRTGDLVRYQPDGRIEFLGRIDQQVKLRGFRIELGEIEAALAQQPGVRETVVVVREDRQGDKRLVAYIVPEEPGAPPQDLRSKLQASLPEYMIPSAFVVLDQLPLTAHSKIDRQNLPAPGYGDTDQSYVAPQNELQQLIAATWREVLQIEHVGIHTPFFDLGADSIRVAQAHTKLCAATNREISILDLFQYPTVSSLEQHLSRQSKPSATVQESSVQDKKLETGKDRIRRLRNKTL